MRKPRNVFPLNMKKKNLLKHKEERNLIKSLQLKKANFCKIIQKFVYISDDV